MIDAFASGGCFHSRTAMGMYPYIKEDIDNGGVLLEWDYAKVRRRERDWDYVVSV